MGRRGEGSVDYWVYSRPGVALPLFLQCGLQLVVQRPLFFLRLLVALESTELEMGRVRLHEVLWALRRRRASSTFLRGSRRNNCT